VIDSISVEDRVVVVRTSKERVKFKIAPDCAIFMDDKPAMLKDLKAAASISVITDAAGTVTKLSARSPALPKKPEPPRQILEIVPEVALAISVVPNMKAYGDKIDHLAE